MDTVRLGYAAFALIIFLWVDASREAARLARCVLGVPFSNSTGDWYPSVECRRRRLYHASIHAKTAVSSSRRVGQARRRVSSFFSVAKNASQTALSSAQPFAPIETAIPAARAVWPKISDTYWADSSGRRNALIVGVLMGRPAGWMVALTGRSPMKSPGRPSLRREVQRAFWREIATGLTSEQAGVAVGASQAAGSRWFREGGGMPSIDPG